MNRDGTRSTQGFWAKAVYCSTGDYTTDNAAPSGLAIAQLSRITDLNWTVEYALEQPTYLNAGTESYLTVLPGGTLNLKWLHTEGHNEMWLGLAQQVGPNGTLAFNLDAPKSLYITVENTPVDAVGASGAGQGKTVVGLAQCLLTQYSIGASVGTLIQSEANLGFLTSFIYPGVSGNAIPAVDYQSGAQVTGQFTLPAADSQFVPNGPTGYYPTGSSNYVSAIAARDMILTFPQGTPFGVVLTGDQSCFLQSFNCSLTVNRQAFKPMGFQYPRSRPVVYPIQVDLTTQALVSSYQADRLSRFGCLGTGQAVYLTVKQPCSNATLFGLYFDNLQLLSQQFVTSIGRNDVVTLNWRGLITSPIAPFFTPGVNFIVRLDTSGAWGTNW